MIPALIIPVFSFKSLFPIRYTIGIVIAPIVPAITLPIRMILNTSKGSMKD